MFWDSARNLGFLWRDLRKKFGRSFDELYGKIIRELVQQGLMQIDGDRVRMTKRVSFRDTVAERFILSRTMGLTYQMKMKIPFDMADMNGHISCQM